MSRWFAKVAQVHKVRTALQQTFDHLVNGSLGGTDCLFRSGESRNVYLRLLTFSCLTADDLKELVLFDSPCTRFT